MIPSRRANDRKGYIPANDANAANPAVLRIRNAISGMNHLVLEQHNYLDMVP